MRTLDRHPVSASIAGTVALLALLIVLTLTLPLGGNAAHAVGHLSIGLPLLLLLALALHTWPHAGSGVASRLARGMLLVGLGVASSGLFVEAVGAFGYSEHGYTEASSLTALHDVGVALWPIGLLFTTAGAIMTAGVALAARSRAVGSRVVTAAVVVAATAVVAFVVGAFIFGY